MRTTRLLCWITLAVLAAAAAGCLRVEDNSSVTAADLVGTYQITFNTASNTYAGTETLVFSDDGTYTQTYTAPSKQVFKNAGKWEREQLGTQVNALVLDYHVYFDSNVDAFNLRTPRTVANGLRVAQHGERLVVNDDLQLFFQKVK